jgi:molybdenum cofactor guanylyltransferase
VSGPPSTDIAPTPAAEVALVLIGGASRRFGSDKASLRVAGASIVDRVAGCARDAGLRPVLLGRDPGAVGALEAWAWRLDDEPDGGPLRAIVTAARAAGSPGAPIVVLPVDLPRVTAAHVALLAAPLGRGAAWRCVATGGRAAPLPGALGPVAIAALADAAARGERSLWRALVGVARAELTSADLEAAGLDPRGLHDADTAEAWARLVGDGA